MPLCILCNIERKTEKKEQPPSVTATVTVCSLFTTSSLYPSAGFVSCLNQHHLLVNYVHDVKDILQVYELSTGKLVRDLPLDVGTVAGVSCKKKHSEFFYKFTSFTTPG